jgi:hypothetical protein
VFRVGGARPGPAPGAGDPGAGRWPIPDREPGSRQRSGRNRGGIHGGGFCSVARIPSWPGFTPEGGGALAGAALVGRWPPPGCERWTSSPVREQSTGRVSWPALTHRGRAIRRGCAAFWWWTWTICPDQRRPRVTGCWRPRPGAVTSTDPGGAAAAGSVGPARRGRVRGVARGSGEPGPGAGDRRPGGRRDLRPDGPRGRHRPDHCQRRRGDPHRAGLRGCCRGLRVAAPGLHGAAPRKQRGKGRVETLERAVAVSSRAISGWPGNCPRAGAAN